MELIIIGAGPGGFAAAMYGAKRGLQITLIDKAELGGTCLNRGCIPTKAILHCANTFHQAKGFADLGINVAIEGIDYNKISKRRNQIVTRLKISVEKQLKRAGVTIIHGEARLAGDNQVKVVANGEEKILTADKIILATGAVPTEISGIVIDGEVVINSDHALALDQLPDSIVIIGGGVIGCEFAQAFARLGCEVSIIELMPRLLPGVDSDASTILQKTLAYDGVKIYLGASVTSVKKDATNAVVTVQTTEGEKEIITRKVLIAVGRKPILDRLGLDVAGVNHENGFIMVDEQMRTNQNDIYAIGDVTAGIQLAHVASFGGVVAVKDMLGEEAGMADIAVPMCVYTEPEIVSVGLTLEAAKERGLNYRIAAFPLSANSRAIISGELDGFAKMIIDEDGTILGACLVGGNVSEMISLLGGLINFQTNVEDMKEIMFAHPSISEIISESIAATPPCI